MEGQDRDIETQAPIVSQPPPEQSAFSKLLARVEAIASKFDIGHLLILLLGLHLFAMSFPNGNTDYVFDEAYYVPAAKDLLLGAASNIEHPFFGKIWGSLGIYLFGNDFFGWRIFYVIIGVLAVYALYLIALNFMP